MTIDLSSIPDEQLLVEIVRAAADERRATVRLLALLGEVDARRLYLGVGCSSLFTYCTQVLHLAENAAYFRIEAARAARSYPVILDLIADGDISLTAVRMLRPHLTSENHRELLAAATHKTKDEVAVLVAQLRPLAPVPASIRKLPCKPGLAQARILREDRRTDCESPAATGSERESESVAASASVPGPSMVAPLAKTRPVVAPVSAERYRIQCTISADAHAQLRQVQQLLRHRIPSGDPGEIFTMALGMLLEHLQRTRLAATDRPRRQRTEAPSPRRVSRHIPAAVKRAVWVRDGGRCAFAGTAGRCTETGFLEFHHVVPYAAGGAATAENVELRCRAHNVYEGELFFGREAMIARETQADYVVDSNTVWTVLVKCIRDF